MNRFLNTLAAVSCSWFLLTGALCPFSSTLAFGQITKPFNGGSSEEITSTKPPVSTQPQVTPEIRGDILMANRKYVEAINAYQAGPLNSPTIWNKMGVAYHHLFAFHEAKRDYEQALKLNPKYAEALNNMGSICYEEKNYGRAEKFYKKSLKYQPDSAVTYSNLGTAYFAHRKYQSGTEAYQKALSLDPGIFERDSLGKIEHQGPPGQRATLSYYLAKTYAQAGMTEKALIYLRKAFDNGFNDRKKLMEDQEFSALRKTPEFRKLLQDENLHWAS
jgi:tetratricopeptide (TPR) repeat protein